MRRFRWAVRMLGVVLIAFNCGCSTDMLMQNTGGNPLGSDGRESLQYLRSTHFYLAANFDVVWKDKANGQRRKAHKVCRRIRSELAYLGKWPQHTVVNPKSRIVEGGQWILTKRNTLVISDYIQIVRIEPLTFVVANETPTAYSETFLFDWPESVADEIPTFYVALPFGIQVGRTLPALEQIDVYQLNRGRLEALSITLEGETVDAPLPDDHLVFTKVEDGWRVSDAKD